VSHSLIATLEKIFSGVLLNILAPCSISSSPLASVTSAHICDISVIKQLFMNHIKHFSIGWYLDQSDPSNSQLF